LLLLDDRSSDKTGGIADRLAAGDSRVKTVHIKELPPGWLGKVNALNEGARLARGEWLLFSDADVYFRPGAVAAAVEYAQSRGLDHLAVIPRLENAGLLTDSAISVFVRLMALAPGIYNAGKPGAKSAVGIGAFNLVRREFFARTPGFEWLRLEVIDDMGLALLVKTHGGKSAVADGTQFVSLHFYRTLSQLRRGVEKGVFAGAQYSPAALFAGTVIFWLAEMSPLAGLVWGGAAAHLACALALCAAVYCCVLMNSWNGRGVFSAILFPVGDTLGAALALWAGLRPMLSGRIKWRDTEYSLAELEKNRRFSFRG